MTKTNKPKPGTFDIATRSRCAAHETHPAVGMCRACLNAKPGREARKGLVCGGWGTHKNPGKGVYFYTFTHLETGLSVNVYPPHETKASAAAYLAKLADGSAPEVATTEALLAKHGRGWGGTKTA